MNNEQEHVYYEQENIGREIFILFRDTPIIEDETLFCRTHYFKDKDCKSITRIFKDELVQLFNVSDVQELINIINNKIRLYFKVGKGKMTYDEQSNTVIVYMETFKDDFV